jgi:hypothetical protein
MKCNRWISLLRKWISWPDNTQLPGSVRSGKSEKWESYLATGWRKLMTRKNLAVTYGSGKVTAINKPGLDVSEGI